MITFPGRPVHTFFTSLSVVGLLVPGSTATTLIFLGVTPPTVAVAPGLMFVPVTSRKNCPVSDLSSLQPVTVAITGVPPVPGVPGALQANVTWMPASFPVIGHG